MQKRILIVDDERPLLKFYERTFVNKGYLVSTAESAHEALGKLSTEKYLVMFFDLKMPEMNGINLLKIIRKDHGDVPIIMITGYPSVENVEFVRVVDDGHMVIRVWERGSRHSYKCFPGFTKPRQVKYTIRENRCRSEIPLP